MHEKNVQIKVVFCITGIVCKLAGQEKKKPNKLARL